MSERKNHRKAVRDPLKRLDAQAYRRAFGEPDAEFHDRVRDTLFLIQEKEDTPVKKKMTFSLAFALIVCICLATAAFAGSSMLNGNQPDNTLVPLSQSQNTIMPVASDPLYYRSSDMGFYHRLTRCFGSEQGIPTTEYDIKRLYLTACSYCVFDTVYCMEESVLYHKTADCTAFGEHDLMEITFDRAIHDRKTACPICIASSCIFWPEGEKYTDYHLRICSEMEAIADHSAAVQGTVAEARACGRELCETCKSSAVLYSPNQPYMSHLDAECMECMGEENAEWIPLSSALSIEASGCALCMDDVYYCVPWNAFYHRDYECSDLNAGSVMLLSEEEAILSGRTLCTDCVLDDMMVQPTPAPAAADSNTVTVYADDGGIYYHTDYKCSAMTNPKKWQSYPLAQALNLDRTACPICLHFSAVTSTPMPTTTPIAFEPRTVYFVENGGIHYHTDYACSGMKNPQLGSVEYAKHLGKTACPVCMDVSSTPVPMEDSTLVYMTDYNGIYYHYDENCMNMVGAYYTTFESMRSGDNRPQCPLCVFDAVSRPEYVWSAQGDSYYHSEQSCSSRGSARVTFAIAENRRQTACPTCIGSQEDTYYYRADGAFFHADKGCAALRNCEVSSGTLAQVKAMNRTPCPNCYEPSSTDITYYAVPNDYSYHTQFSCASDTKYDANGNQIDKYAFPVSFTEIFTPSGSAYNFHPCPDCVLSEPVAASAAAQSTDSRIPLMRNEAMTAPEGAPRAITINALDFDKDSVGTCSDLAVDFSCDVLTVHSTIMMHSRGAIYTEFEFTLHDASVDPDSIRLIPYCEESGSLGCLWAEVQEIHYDNGETGYLLCQMMNSPSLEYGADSFRLYVGEQVMAQFQ